MQRLRIAQVAPLYESVPPKLYGGTERVVSHLTEALVDQGYDITLFASGDSKTRARLIPAATNALRLSNNCIDQLAHHVRMLQLVQDQLNDFDIVHYHIDYLHFPLSRLTATPQITTLHGRLDIPDLKPLYSMFSDMPVISISNNQRKPLPDANWIDTVYHGLPEEMFAPEFRPGNYLAFLGRISKEKRVDRAIEIAMRAGIPLKIAAKVDKSDREYFETVRHLLDHPLIEFIGEIGDNEKQEFLSKAKALIFPIDWEEPFGLVMIEAIACGTPVVAFENGSVCEIIEHDRTGFIVNSIDAAVDAVRKLEMLDRRECRMAFEERFTASHMAANYINAYSRVMQLTSNNYNLKTL